MAPSDSGIASGSGSMALSGLGAPSQLPSENATNEDNNLPDPGSLGDHQNGPPDANKSEGPVSYDCRIEEIQIMNELIKLIQNANLGDDHCGLGPDFIFHLRNPPEYSLTLDDPDVRLSIDVYLATTNASQEVYNAVREGVLRRYPDSQMLSFDRVKHQVAELSGVFPIIHDMCVNSCLAYTSPWAQYEHCPYCGEERYDQQKSNRTHRVSRQNFVTIPIGPQLQALWRTPEGAHNMRYQQRCTAEILAELENNGGNISVYNDILCGSDYLDQVIEGKIQSGNMVLILSVNGAQLYQMKASDTWIYIWVVVDHAPEARYKKKYVLPSGFIPGPLPPKNTDSYFFPGLHHLSAIQKEGLRVWDTSIGHVITSNIFFLLGCADVMGMAPMSGLVGHHGKNGCRVYCSLPGRHKRGLPHY
jgi:hypothetical protein